MLNAPHCSPTASDILHVSSLHPTSALKSNPFQCSSKSPNYLYVDKIHAKKKKNNLASPISTSKSSTKHGTKPRSFTKARAGLASPKPPQLSCSTASRSSLAARCARCACRELWILEGEDMAGNYGCLPGILDMKLWKILFFCQESCGLNCGNHVSVF